MPVSAMSSAPTTRRSLSRQWWRRAWLGLGVGVALALGLGSGEELEHAVVAARLVEHARDNPILTLTLTLTLTRRAWWNMRETRCTRMTLVSTLRKARRTRVSRRPAWDPCLPAWGSRPRRRTGRKT